MLTPRTFGHLITEAGRKWVDDNVARLGAALAYYSVFSLGPILILGTSLATAVLGRSALDGGLPARLQLFVGSAAAKALQSLADGAQHNASQGFAATLGIITLIFAATGVLVELKDALNLIWKVTPPKGQGLWTFLRRYLISLVMVLAIGFLLIATLAVTTGLAGVSKFLENDLDFPAALLQGVNFIASFGILVLVFATMYKILPDAKIAWSDVWIGAAVTALLFDLGKSAVGLYIGRQAFESSYGAAGSFLGLLAWIYYSAQIMFFGAEFTHVYAHLHGSKAGDEGVQGESTATPSPWTPARPATRLVPPRLAPTDH